MIWEALLNILFGLVEAFLGLLPAYTPGEYEPSSALAFLISGIRVVNNWFVLSGFVGVLVLWGTIEVAMTATRVVQWAYAKIPGKAT